MRPTHPVRPASRGPATRGPATNSSHWTLFAVGVLVALTAAPIAAQDARSDARSEAVRGHVRALEESHRIPLDALIDQFRQERLSDDYLARTTDADLRQVLEAVRNAAAEAGGVGVNVEGDRFVLTLSGPRRHRVSFGVMETPPFRMNALSIQVVVDEELDLTRENLGRTLRELEARGMAGAGFVRLDGEVVFSDGFGPANEHLGTSNDTETVFGIGSRPIDFTIAAVHLLRHQGRLSLDDSIAEHFPDVPSDKTGITISHLLTGASGLPDFFHRDVDWDPDLAWIDRQTAERRLLGQTLLFEPGTDRRHSHGAFGLLAALVERASGQPYYEFLREHFLDPAGMERTGENGETRGLSFEDFAAGYDRQSVGTPNIPPNWGPTSWLIKGSGGMYSTIGDLQRFYEFVRTNPRFDDRLRSAFAGTAVSLDGSDRGFELFSIRTPDGDEVFLFFNRLEDAEYARRLFRALEQLVVSSS